MKKNSDNSEISVIGLTFEVILVSIIFTTIAYFTNRNDPFFINRDINIVLILVSVITLFYGLLGGILLVTIIGYSLTIFYPNFPSKYYLNLILFMLIFSEFNYFWNRKIKKIKEKLDYYEKKINELTKSFYALKISHDQIEKSYITKPRSLRNVISEIKKLYILNPEKAYEEIFEIITKNYSIRKAAMYLVEKEKFKRINVLNSNRDINITSRVLNEAMERKSPAYLSIYSDLRKDYLAVIPANDSNDNIKFILVIEDMPFFNFNKDNIFSIWIIISYFADFMSGFKYAEDLIKHNPSCPEDFLIETKRLSYIYSKTGLKTMITIIKTNNENTEHETIKSAISERLRSVDIICSKENIIFILFPFSSYETIKPVVDKIKYTVQNLFGIKENEMNILITEVKETPQKTFSIINKLISNGH